MPWKLCGEQFDPSIIPIEVDPSPLCCPAPNDAVVGKLSSPKVFNYIHETRNAACYHTLLAIRNVRGIMLIYNVNNLLMQGMNT